MELTWTKLILGGAVLIGVPVALVVGWPLINAVRVRRQAPTLCAVPSRHVEGGPYLRGRVAVVNEEKKWDVLIGTYLPEDLVARSPSEVTTCVVLDWSWRVDGTYDVTKIAPDGTKTPDGQAAAKQQTCHAIIVDRSIQAVVGEADFAGRVPDAIRTDGTGTDPTMGQKPIDELEEWLHGLPRK